MVYTSEGALFRENIGEEQKKVYSSQGRRKGGPGSAWPLN